MANRGKKHKSRETLGQRHYSFWSARLSDDASYVYVIRSGKNNPVKIGVAKKPLQRLKTLQTGNPQRLRLLLVVPGDTALEVLLHHRFAGHRLDDSEWFYGQAVADIIEFVTALSIDMVRAHIEGDPSPPPLSEFERWTVAERLVLQEREKPPLPPIQVRELTPQEVERVKVIEAARNQPNYVPTLAQRIRGTKLRLDEQNRAGATQ